MSVGVDINDGPFSIKFLGQKQQQQLEVNPKNIVSTSMNVFPPGKAPPVNSDRKQLYKSKQSSNSA